MLAKGQITVSNIDDGKTPFLHQAYKMKDGRFLKHYPVYEVPPVNGYKEGDLWHKTDGKPSGYFVANKSNTTFDFNDWTFYADELAYSDTDKFYPKFEGTYSDYNEIASDDQTKYTWKIIKADDGIGIKSVKEYYAISTSNVTPPSSWSETPKATNTTNKYLWNYEVYTYSNGDVKETAKRVIGTHGTTGATGASGKDGIAGKDGKGISSTTITYGLSTTDTVEPTNYTSNVPTLVKGRYLWTKTVWKYTDNTTETGYTKTYIAKDGNSGKDGIAGKDGVGIDSTSITYVSSTSGTTKPTSGWVSTVPTVSPGQYLWTKTTWTYTDNTTETGYSVARMGSNGATGATGNGITSVTNRYLATTLATGVTTATSGWTTTVQKTDSVKKYLWNYEEVIYTNGSKIPTTPVIIGTHGEKGDKGQNSVTGLLTNESITLPANKDGVVPASGFTGAKGVFDVYDGVTKKTGSGVKYSVVSQSNITVSIDATGAYSVTAMPTGKTVLNGYAVLSAIYNGVTIEKQLNVSKSLTGATGATGATGPKGATGSQGPKGDVGTSVSSVTEYYLATTLSTGVTTSTSGWSTAMQPMTATNKYLWNYEKINFSDSTSQPTIPVIIGVYGDKGQTGSTGATGRSITSITEHYLATSASSGVTRSTSGWSTAIKPTTPTNKYLWNYETVNWSSGTTPTYVEPIIIGVHGDKGDKGDSGKDGIAGKDGKGIKSTVIAYATSTNGTTQPASGWGAAVPSLTKGQYLWTRTIWTYTDNTTETGYSVSYIAKDGNTGKDGIAGKDGVGISKTTITYAKSTNGTTAPTTGYTTTVPSTKPGDYLWTKTVWTYTDNTTETGYSVGKIGNTGATGATGPQGPQGATGARGPQGIQGPAGSNGQSQWVHIRYSANANGSSMTTTPSSTTKYVGIAVNSSSTAPAYTGFTWSKYVGENGSTGPQGIQGPKGANGQTTYTWIRYADTPTSGMNQYPEGKKYIGLAFNKTTQTESSNYSDYKWSLMPQNIEIGTKTQDELENISHIYFDNNGYIEFPDEAKNLVHGGTEATIEFWNKQDSLAYGLVQLSGFNDSNGILYPYQNYQTVYLDVFRTNRLGPITMKKPVDRWHHFAITTHPTEGWKLYQDGDLVYTASAQSTVNVSYLKFRVGQNSGNRYSNAGYRDIRLWNKARTHQEIITNMNQDVPESEDGLVGYWKVNEGSGETVLDLVNGNNGAIINGEWRGLQSKLNEKADQEQVNNALGDINESLEDKIAREEFEKLEQLAKQFAESYEGFVQDGGQHEQDLINLEDRMTQSLLSLDDKVLELDFLKTYMKFGDEGFMIGKDDSQIKMLLKNDRLSFMDAGKEVAFFSGQSFYINRGAVVQSLQVGEHKLTNLGNGHTIFQWVG